MPPETREAPDLGGRDWWERSDRHYDAAGQLWFGGRPVPAMIAQWGTPTYVYSAARITQNVVRLRAALDSLGMPTRLYYAMKSNRFPPVLALLRDLGVGIDACSPGEVRRALQGGFEEEAISFTAGSLSRRDYAALAGWPDLRINADSISALRRFAEGSPGRRIGLRINPGIGIGYAGNEKVHYAGARPSKFGVYFDRFAEALAVAGECGLQLDGLHCHAGCGFLSPQLPVLGEIFTRIGAFLDAAPQITRINLGGGLGIPLREGDAELDLDAWAALVRTHFGHRGLEIAIEPGDYLVKDAGALLTEITQVEEKGGRVFVGVDAGFSTHPEPAFYALPLEPVPVQRRDAAAPTPVCIVGNINEALDIWAEEAHLAGLEEGGYLCWINAGGYGAAMASEHCLRHEFSEHLITPEAAKGVDPGQLSSTNQRAWDALYAATDDLVWGSDPLPFLTEFRGDFQSVLTSPSRLLDAGVGEGRNLPYLLDCGADEVHAVDASPHALRKIPPPLASRAQRHLAELGHTGYPDRHFDALTLLDTIETLPDAAAVLVEMFRILKPGGLLLCNIPGLDDGVAGLDMRALSDNAFLYRDRYYFHFIEPTEAEAMLGAAGFEIVRAVHRKWRESGHPGFRDETHTHVSHVFLVRRPGDAESTV